ncbi:MAG: hypothetical protein HOM58_08850 [Rhodospirillaceae bacterium]|jgi:hypothetical protein|nr:hypothetical protein [Rhodospirillaceae bacterium]MBT5456225.1 hypothetical protein [Rhodospirillaceae bacterium]
MRALLGTLDSTSRATSYLMGGLAVILAIAVLMTSSSVTDIAGWAREVLGWTFVALLGSLVFLALFSWVRMLQTQNGSSDVWFEAGVQAANGVTTLALTFTLLGISLGIGTLAGQELTPETIQPVIRKMTANFSLAFMTTVIGLPISALLRSVLIVTHARNRTADHQTANSLERT